MGSTISGVDIGGAWGARAPPEFVGTEKGTEKDTCRQSITASNPGFEKVSKALSL